MPGSPVHKGAKAPENAFAALGRILNTEIKVLFVRADDRAHEQDRSRLLEEVREAGSGAMRELTVNEYSLKLIERRGNHVFHLRYAAHGDFSNMVAAHGYAAPPGVRVRSSAGPNAMSMAIEYAGEAMCAVSLVFDGEAGLSADARFPEQMGALRARSGRMICEFTEISISRTNKARRVIGGMFHLSYLFARQARQAAEVIIQVRSEHAKFFEKMFGFESLAEQDDVRLMHMGLDDMKRRIRQFGGNPEQAELPGAGLYPFFFKHKDEPGLLYRLLEHLGTGNSFGPKG